MTENELRKLLQEHEMNDQAKLNELTERMIVMITKKSRQVRRSRRVVALIDEVRIYDRAVKP